MEFPALRLVMDTNLEIFLKEVGKIVAVLFCPQL